MLRAVIFDCDGTIADNEPLHLAMFQKTLSEVGFSLSKKDYYDIYLGMDDKDCFTTFLEANGEVPDPSLIKDLIIRKAGYFEEAIQKDLYFLPGALELIRLLSKQFPLAIASGALRHEVELVLNAGKVIESFKALVAAENVTAGKPNPEGFQKALFGINILKPKPDPPIQSEECLVIEDSYAGVEAAKSAEMRCLAVTNSYPADKLHQADRIVDTLEGITIESLESMFDNKS